MLLVGLVKRRFQIPVEPHSQNRGIAEDRSCRASLRHLDNISIALVKVIVPLSAQTLPDLNGRVYIEQRASRTINPCVILIIASLCSIQYERRKRKEPSSSVADHPLQMLAFPCFHELVDPPRFLLNLIRTGFGNSKQLAVDGQDSHTDGQGQLESGEDARCQRELSNERIRLDVRVCKVDQSGHVGSQHNPVLRDRWT